MSLRSFTTCDQCGQSDDHPKVHYGPSTWHHDCTPAAVKAEILGGAHANDPEKLEKIFTHAEAGVHGEELLVKIFELHDDGGK